MLNFHRTKRLIFPLIMKQFCEVQDQVDLMKADLGNWANDMLRPHQSALKHGWHTFLYSAMGELVCSGQLWASAALKQLPSYKIG